MTDIKVDRSDVKVGKFQEAINHYATQQRNKIEQEVAQYKQRELERAENEVLQEAYHLIQNEMAAMRSRIASEMSQREQNLRRELLARREEITKACFSRAEKELLAFTKEPGYSAFLTGMAKQCAPLFADAADTVVHVRPGDEAHQAALGAIFGGKCSFVADSSIRLGGLLVESKALGIVADQSLDARLEEQREWFETHCGMAVV